jgi:hypothetical protein
MVCDLTHLSFILLGFSTEPTQSVPSASCTTMMMTCKLTHEIYRIMIDVKSKGPVFDGTAQAFRDGI